MIIMKFGGTSIGNGSRIRGLAERVREHQAMQPVLVVSALAGTTDALLAAIEAANLGMTDQVEKVLSELVRAHRWAIHEVVEASDRRHELVLRFDRNLDELRELLRSIRVLGESSPKVRDAVLAYGERYSATLVCAALLEAGIPAELVNPSAVLKTDSTYGAAIPDLAATEQACTQLQELLSEGKVPVIGGFTGGAPNGSVTTLGRGGSDTTAAVLGCVLNADEVQIWTDVDGILTADPRLYPDAASLKQVSFPFAARLAVHGAKVLHPASLAPVVQQGIPLSIRNSLNPDFEGTLVTATSQTKEAILSFATKSEILCIRSNDKSLIPGRLFSDSLDLPIGNTPFASLTCGFDQLVLYDGKDFKQQPPTIPGAALEVLPEVAWLAVVAEGEEASALIDRLRAEVSEVEALMMTDRDGFSVVVKRSQLVPLLSRLHSTFDQAGVK